MSRSKHGSKGGGWEFHGHNGGYGVNTSWYQRLYHKVMRQREKKAILAGHEDCNEEWREEDGDGITE